MKEIFIEKVLIWAEGWRKHMFTKTVQFLGQKLWRTLPADIKDSGSLSMFKRKIKMYTVSFDCRLSKRYVENLGYI